MSTAAKPAPGTVNLAPMVYRAAVRSVDAEKRTVDLIISTGAKVLREGWDGPFWEELSLEKKHVRMKRLNNGAPLLDSHGSGWGGPTLGDQFGVVERASIEAGNDGPVMVATVRFARADDDAKADQAFRKTADGIIRNVSIGYRTYRIEKIEGGEGTIPTYRATDWEPYEVSLVPMGADDGAKVRGEELQRNACRVVAQPIAATRTAAPPKPPKPATKETRMEDATRSETLLEDDDPQPATRTPEVTPPDETAVATRIERERSQGILLGCRAARLPQSFADGLIAEGIKLVDAQTRILGELAKRGGDDRGPGRTPSGASDVVVGDDPFVHKRKGIENALLHRAMPPMGASGSQKACGFELTEEGRQYRGLGLMDIADIFLRSRGMRVSSLSKMERASAALGMRIGGMHSTSDFPLLLADVANKVLRAAYEAQAPTWGPISKDVPLADFKPTKQLQLGDAPALLEVMEHGEFTSGTIAEGKEQFQLKTYGRIFAITRQALINDDTNAFAEVPAAFGRMARVKESDLAWAEITANPVMGDGVALFNAAHFNLDTVNAAIAIGPVGKGRAALRVQKGLDTTTLLNLNPSYLIVPAALETVADQFVSTALMASVTGSVNPFAGRLQVISEPRLDANSVTAWYLATAVSQAPVLFHGTLDGQPGPEVTQEQGFDVDGVRMKCRIDVAFKAADFHGVWKNVGV